MIDLTRTIVLLLSFAILAYVLFRKRGRNEKHSDYRRLNWAIFFAALWVSLSLFVVNYISVKAGYWSFAPDESTNLLMPPDVFFVWIVLWGVIIPFLFKGQHLFLLSLFIFWTDILFMPILETYGLLDLKEHWLIGELLLLVIVFLPAQYWVALFMKGKYAGRRSLFQVICMAILYGFIIPFCVAQYSPKDIQFDGWNKPILLQFAFIILLPGLIAVVDLGQQGEGTPFPFDPTKKMVQTGVYAYIKNPIQWSLSLIFVPLAVFFHSYYLLSGTIVSIAYAISIANHTTNILTCKIALEKHG